VSRESWKLAGAMIRQRPAAIVAVVAVAVFGLAIVITGAVVVAGFMLAGAGGDLVGRLVAVAVGLFVAEVRPRRPPT